MDLSVVSKIVALYGATLRRNREVYVSHCLRVAEGVRSAGFNDRAVLLGMLHDALELDLPNVSIDTLKDQFRLSDKEIDVLNLLTAKEGESSEEHHQRIIDANYVVVNVIKYYDNIDNSIMSSEDQDFTSNVLGKDPAEESQKYCARATQFKELLAAQGIEVYYFI